jgi:hypothetical protein
MKRYPTKTYIKSGRKFVQLDNDLFRYSRFIVEEFVRPLGPGEIVHHRDENTLNDNLDNLEILTRAEHTRLHKKGQVNSKKINERRRLSQIGEKCHSSKLKQKEVDEIRHLCFHHFHEWTYESLAEEYNVSRSTINGIVNGDSWNPKRLTRAQLEKLY